MNEIDFDSAFCALTTKLPFPWQQALYAQFSSGNIPASCNLPTGLGKTSVIAIWLIALLNGKRVPRRLAYVVNRRTVVDQTTDEVEKYRRNLKENALFKKVDKHLHELAISTLRGQFADNREWSGDPSRPAVICGTVDMIGSRLLFSGYSVGFKGRPLHAGFLGQDTLLVHDEAHLEPAFQNLLLDIEKEQHRCHDFAPFRVMELTATSRGTGEAFGLSDADFKNETVQQRMTSAKKLILTSIDDEKNLADTIGKLALEEHFKNSNKAILIFARSVKDVQKIAGQLEKAKQSVKQLTGTMRGWERDRLVEDETFQRFLPDAIPQEKTVYLVCTSAGEVGVNISADHLICDLSTFESMAQRFGRVNRFGKLTDTEIHVFYPEKFGEEEIDQRRQKTFALLEKLEGDASPSRLGTLDPESRTAAFAPPPTILPTSDILFDSWALTSIRGKLPGRPPVAEYLHGISTWEPPETYVAWREEVSRIHGKELLEEYPPEDLLEDYPLKPHELLRDTSARIYETLKKLKADPTTPVWLIADDDSIDVVTLKEVVEAGKEELADKVVLLPPKAGGLAEGGSFSAESTKANDVADKWLSENDTPARTRVWDDEAVPSGMRLIRRIDLTATEDEETEEVDEINSEGEEQAENVGNKKKVWLWYESQKKGDGDGSKSSQRPVTWDVHTQDVEENLNKIIQNLSLPDNLPVALRLAAKWHDLGKKRKLFQNVLGNFDYPRRILAKSGKLRGNRLVELYRHEFGSLADIERDPEFQKLPDEIKELVRHFIAVHHGRGRPHFAEEEAFDPEAGIVAAAIAAEIPRRFARLQRQYGRWGLAYLESLLRAADYAASAAPSKYEGDE